MDITTYLDPDIIEKIQTGGYILMLGLMILEGPFVTFAGAFLASLGVFDIWIVFLLGWLGDILGDLIFYSIGKYGLHIFQKKTTIDTVKEKSFIHTLDTLIHTNLALAIMIIKFTPYAPPIGLTYIGKIGISLRKYIFTSIIVCAPIPIITTLLGFNIGYLNTIFTKFSGIELIGAIIITLILCSIGGFSYLYLKKKAKNILASKERN